MKLNININFKDLTKEQIEDLKRQIEDHGKEPTLEEYFWQLLGDYSTDADWKQHPGKVFIKNEGGVIVMEFVLKNGYLWVDYNEIWRKIESKFSYKSKEVKYLIKKEVEQHFNLRGVTPNAMFY